MRRATSASPYDTASAGGPLTVGDIIPETHLIVPGEASDAPERVALIAAAPGEAWICKPTTGAHGGGIHIAATAAQAAAHIDSTQAAEPSSSTSTSTVAAEASASAATIDPAPASTSASASTPTSAPTATNTTVIASASASATTTTTASTSAASIDPVTAPEATPTPAPDNSKPWRRGPVKPRASPAWLVQRYVARPMLVDGRKFDIRAFALVGSQPGPDTRPHFSSPEALFVRRAAWSLSDKTGSG